MKYWKITPILLITIGILVNVQSTQAQTTEIQINYSTTDNLSSTERVLNGTQRTPVRITFSQNNQTIVNISQIILNTKTELPQESAEVASAFTFYTLAGNQRFQACDITTNPIINTKTTICNTPGGEFNYLRLTIEPIGALPNPSIIFQAEPYGMTITRANQNTRINRTLTFASIDRPTSTTNSQTNTSNQTTEPTPLQQMIQNFPSVSLDESYNLMPQFKSFLIQYNSFFLNFYPNRNYPLNSIFYHWIDNKN